MINELSMTKITFKKLVLTTIIAITIMTTITAISVTDVFAEPDPMNESPPEVIGSIEGPLAHVTPPSGLGAIIGNGDVILGINPAGHLNVDYRAVAGLGLPAPPDPSLGPFGIFPIGVVGLRSGSDVSLSSTEAGCECEGWGVAVTAGIHSGTTGYANDATGIAGIDVESFGAVDGDLTAVSVVSIPTTGAGAIMKVTHDYHPSPDTSKLYEVTVTVENVSDDPLLDLVYRRVMDWDISPTVFDEFVTITGSATTVQLIAHGDNGFLTANPLTLGPYTINDAACEAGDCTDSGPADHGSVFDFDLGDLDVGESTTLTIFYGVADTESDAILALTAISAELFSL